MAKPGARSMLMPASSEFVSLCRSQTALLIQGLGASSIAVYLTEEVDGSYENLRPIVVYPESVEPGLVRLRLSGTGVNRVQSQLLSAQPTSNNDADNNDAEPLLPATAQPISDPLVAPLPLVKQRLVLPLIHEDIVLGLLVVGREDRQWSELEQVQLNQIANTLAIACILDQRQQWSAHAHHHQRLLQAQQHDTLADLLHQFRNPLTTLRTLGKLLLKRLRPDDANREIAASVIRESERLQDLLQQFDNAIDWREVVAAPDASPVIEGLTLPTPTSRLLPPSFMTALPLESCWLAQILEPLLRSAVAIAQERNLDLNSKIPPDLPPVQGNVQALREVFSNLIDNALKYTPARGQVFVQVSQSHSNYQVVAIHDTGPGIPPQDIDHVFERHYRGVQVQTNIPGTGLGLAIACELVKQMQGEIQVHSPALEPMPNLSPGPGTTFRVWLPSANQQLQIIKSTESQS